MPQAATPEDTRTLLSPAEVAELANVSLKTVYREIDRGELRALHVGRQLRIDRGDFESYLAREPSPTASGEARVCAGVAGVDLLPVPPGAPATEREE
jgi:excisionase family DNA binding protein